MLGTGGGGGSSAKAMTTVSSLARTSGGRRLRSRPAAGGASTLYGMRPRPSLPSVPKQITPPTRLDASFFLPSRACGLSDRQQLSVLLGLQPFPQRLRDQVLEKTVALGRLDLYRGVELLILKEQRHLSHRTHLPAWASMRLYSGTILRHILGLGHAPELRRPAHRRCAERSDEAISHSPSMSS